MTTGWIPRDKRNQSPAARQAGFDESMTKAELIEACQNAGLPADGTKADLLARLRGEDGAQ